ncbi:SDR family NAD(P)-dependent oxidoreductase [Actinoplanes sp. TFC3]|uniref:SDR family NAD(P)-dependent oxidoreductase n=1 Tax=Actinoplanes sp. TFC3 TaxID=1710355 RepID=UPI000833F924|nr:SDR family NAD(P)-dependent oxidoreductase [Actinoplanes sp. TFC3]
MRGKTVLVTGATSGLGRRLAGDLATRGATVLLHGRDEHRLHAVAQELRGTAAAVRTYCADLADLDQVRELTERLRDAEPRLDVLVNNAGLGGGSDPARRETGPQGYELRLTVNHLAPYLLIQELAPLLAASAPARVVNVASSGQVPIALDDVMMQRGYQGIHAYCRSKVALIMATFDLAADLAGRGITVNALHPAELMDTAMVRRSGFAPAATVADGAAATMRLIEDPALDGVTGQYFDRFTAAPAHPQVYDETARARIRVVTEQLTGLQPFSGLPGA